MIDLYEKKLKAEIKKIETETEAVKKKWYQKPDFILKSSDIFLKFLIFIASIISVIYISNLYDIKNERLELKRDKLEFQIGVFENKKDSLNNENLYLSKINDSISNSNNNLLTILTRLKNDSLKQKYLFSKLTKQFKEIKNPEKSKNLQKTLDKLISNTYYSPAKADAGSDISICLGESVWLTGSGGDSYVWNTGAITKSIQVNPTKTTTYTLSVTRGGITNSDTVIVTVENCSSSSNDDYEFIIYPAPTNGIMSTKESENGAVQQQKNLHEKLW